MELYYIGIDGEQAISSTVTRKQADGVKKYECLLIKDGKKVEWDEFDNPKDENSLFQKVIIDKVTRVDKDIYVRTRPNYCIISIIENKAVRLEYYEAELIHDIRAKEIQGKRLPQFLTYRYINDLTEYLENINSYQDLIDYIHE